MPLKIPQNQITYKYTSGKEYMNKDTHREYQGYYYEVNGQLFTGKEFSSNASILIKIDDSNNINKLLTNSSTYIYGKLSKIKIQNIKINTLSSQTLEKITPEETVEYYIKKINSNIIKRVDEETYNNAKINSLYLTLLLKAYPLTDEIYVPKDLDEAEKQIPGIKDFLSV
jgi:hypothetical protein